MINAVAVVLPKMLARSSGHIAIMGSLFGYTGWPENGSYGASKAAVINLAESLKLELEGTGVAVTIINPGFVDTPLIPLNKRLDRSRMIQPRDIAEAVLYVLNTPVTACPVEMTIRPQQTPYR